MVPSSRSSTSSAISRKPIPGSSTSTYDSLTSSAPTLTTATARTSEASESSSRFEADTASTPLSPDDQLSPLSDQGGSFESPAPKALQKAPPIPRSPPPAPPALLTEPGTPQRVPAVTATQATPDERSPSPDRPPAAAMLQPNRLQPRHPSPSPSPRGRSVSAQPPTIRDSSADGLRVVSSPVGGRAHSKPSSEGSPPSATDRRRSRMSWFPGGRSRANSDASRPRGPGAWVMTPDGQVEYNTAPLVNGEKVPELWNESGNVCVYLHPKQSGRGPSFRVADQIFSASAVLNELLVTEMMAASGLYPDAASATRPVTEGHLYLPLGNTDLDCLVAARNLFALLTHQPLVGTAEHPTLFATLLQVAGLLRRFNFTSYDGSSMGESVDTAFGLLMDEFGIADVRHSREKTLEALILAEQMKSWNLYNEAFVHAVGKYEALRHLKSPLFDRISVSTRKRLDRAHLDLAGRRANVNTRLEAFEFPSLFAGIASSTSTEEYKRVRFKEWRNAFGKMRSFVLGYYKSLFGNWPPRARSHKNYFSQSGLNRQCLKILYSDFCALYDLLVDRQSITPRVIGEMYDDPSEGSKEKQLGDASISALRKVLSEFDKSSPPVLPPIPFDIPKIPSMTAVYENFHEMPAKKQAKYSKAVQPHELQLILLKARNIDTDALQFPFLLAYKDFELREARGASPQDLADQRIGYWLFLYAVLQSLPMLVVDAPGLRYTEGVEDFLCEAPQGNPPWTEDAGEVRKMWYQTAGQNIVELSADVVMFSVEGIYMRSHCWLAAKEWEALGPAVAGAALPPQPSSQQQQQQQQQQPSPPPQLSPLQPPRAVFHDMDPFSSSSSPSAGGPPHNNPPDPTTTTSTTTTTSHQQSPASLAAASPGPSAHNSPHLRPRAGSTDERARQAFRASIAIGLEPLALPPPAAAAAMGMGGVHQRASSRVLSAGSLLAPAGAGINGLNGINGGINGGVNGGGGAVAAGGLGAGLGGLGEGRPQPGMLRASRSAVALSQFGGGIGGISGGGAGGEFLGDAAHQYQQQQLRKSSYGGAPGLGHAASESLGGGSTFDDILKGMDHGKKTKKKLFF